MLEKQDTVHHATAKEEENRDSLVIMDLSLLLSTNSSDGVTQQMSTFRHPVTILKL